MNALHKFYQLAWQPGHFMPEAWWGALDLSPWQSCFQQYPCTRRAINLEIISRRQFPQHTQLPEALDLKTGEFLNRIKQLPIFLCALGLWRFEQHEYFVLNTYRQELKTFFGQDTFEQVVNLRLPQAPRSFYVSSPFYAAENLVNEAIRSGYQLLPCLDIDPIAIRAVAITLDPQLDQVALSKPTDIQLIQFTQRCLHLLENWL